MIDLRILLLGAMALLIAAYSSSTASGIGVSAGTEMAMHRAVYGDPLRRHGHHVDGYDLQR